MRSESWKQIKKILEEALELDSTAREEFLNHFNADEEVLAEVKSLLKDEEKTENFLSVPAGSLAGDFLSDLPDSPEAPNGQKIGIYRVVRELGLGGMGAVFLGERIDGEFEQRVAIKLLKREYNTQRIRRSFARERDIQAALAHPNIATLIDAGTTDDGIPYLVMEFVEGLPIDVYCRENHLSLNERLKLFNKACEAVSFAHRNLIVHRDLKPSNIIVGENGEPKLLDFGISKLLSDDGGDATITNLEAMTPKYASPEQIKAEKITTSSDIYSLGVILFKLLTNGHPFDDADQNGGVLEAIVDKEPRVPSNANSFVVTEQGLDEDLPFEASKLKGDLDNIILKSLRKKPERRYTTVEQFTADIWRFLDMLPVNARPATLTYRTRKFFNRNKIPAIAGLLAVVGLIVGLSVALWQATVAKQQALIARNAQIRAEVEATKSKAEEETAKEITNFMDNLIAYANPGSYARGAKVRGQAKVIDAIEDMGNSIETEIPDRKDIQAELHHKFAEVFLMHRQAGNENRKMIERSEFHARRALELRKEHYGEKHELVAKDIFYLVSANVPTEESPVKLLAEAIEMMREANPNNLNLGHMLISYANRLFVVGTEKEKADYLKFARDRNKSDAIKLAENYYREALGVFRKHHQDDHVSIVGVNCRIGQVMVEQGRFGDLKPYYSSCRNLPDTLDASQVSTLTKIADQIEKAMNGKAPDS